MLSIALIMINAMHPLSKSFVDHVKENASFEVMDVEENPFSYWTLDEIVWIMGTKIPNMEDLPNYVIVSDSLPIEFNFETATPKCKKTI